MVAMGWHTFPIGIDAQSCGFSSSFEASMKGMCFFVIFRLIFLKIFGTKIAIDNHRPFHSMLHDTTVKPVRTTPIVRDISRISTTPSQRSSQGPLLPASGLSATL